jgi:hypothetical protein
MSGGGSLLEGVGVEAPVSTLVTGSAHRDKDLNKSLASDRYHYSVRPDGRDPGAGGAIPWP